MEKWWKENADLLWINGGKSVEPFPLDQAYQSNLRGGVRKGQGAGGRRESGGKAFVGE